MTKLMRKLIPFTDSLDNYDAKLSTHGIVGRTTTRYGNESHTHSSRFYTHSEVRRVEEMAKSYKYE